MSGADWTNAKKAVRLLTLVLGLCMVLFGTELLCPMVM